MKITFFSNYLSHHQLPFCLEMEKKFSGNFKFIATSPISKERINLGYQDMNKQFSFVITTYDNVDNYQYAKKLAIESEIVIIGSAPKEFMEERLKLNKITFKYSERFFKKGLSIKQLPKAYISAKINIDKYKKFPLYFLCASAYTSADVNRFSDFRGRTYKWGYFPETKRYNIKQLYEKKNHDKIQILWCGRFLKWKHPEIMVYLAEKLREDGYEFKINMIGSGELTDTIREMIKDKKLDKYIQLLGAMSSDQVRLYMEKSNLFLFTSDFNEGWGAVLNEAMSSGCAVVASHAIGSVPYLIEHEINGLIYVNNDLEDLYTKVVFLITNPDKQKQFGINAYYTLVNEWNAEVATNRFIQLIQEIQKKGDCNLFEKGICSKAKILNNDWLK